MNKYLEAKEKRQNEINNFPMFFAFTEEMLRSGMEEMGLDPDKDMQKVIYIGQGGLIKKEDAKAYLLMVKRHAEEHVGLLNDKQYVEDMFYYELKNHEYGYDLSTEGAIEATGLTKNQIAENALWSEALEKMCRKIRKEEGYEF